MRLTSFSKTTSEDLDAAVQEMKQDGAKAIILDLRDNLGGLLPAATAVVNKFVANGVIVRTQADRVTSNPPIVINGAGGRDGDGCADDRAGESVVGQRSEIVSGARGDDRRA